MSVVDILTSVLLTSLLFIDCSKLFQETHQRETIPDEFVFFPKIGKAKRVNKVSKIRVCM